MCQVTKKQNIFLFCCPLRREKGAGLGERIVKSEELRCAALRHGFGKGCLGEAGGTNQKKAPSRVPSLIREGSDRLERGRRFGAKKKARSAIRLQAPACGRSGPFRSQTVWYHKKGRGRVWGTAGSCHTWSEAEVPAAAGGKRKRHLSVPFSFGAEDGTRTHTPKYWLLRPERLPFRHFRLFHFGPAHSQNSRPTSTRIIPFLALACQFPGLSPPFGGCLSTGVVLG